MHSPAAQVSRPLYVYRLVVDLPDLKNDEPDNWAAMCLERYWPVADEETGETTFRWPRRRLFFSYTAAQTRAAYLRECGAMVAVVRSAPVVFASTTSDRTAVANQAPLPPSGEQRDGHGQKQETAASASVSAQGGQS